MRLIITNYCGSLSTTFELEGSVEEVERFHQLMENRMAKEPKPKIDKYGVDRNSERQKEIDEQNRLSQEEVDNANQSTDQDGDKTTSDVTLTDDAHERRARRTGKVNEPAEGNGGEGEQGF